MVDPSNLQTDDLSKGFLVTVFTRHPEDNVPLVKIGDVFLLRGMIVCTQATDLFSFVSLMYPQVSTHQPWNGMCASYKTWNWVLFCTETGDTKQSPGSSVSFTLSEAELEYRTKLIDWWKTIQERYERELRESGVTIHQLGEGDGPSYGNRAARVHRLIKDASPSAPPGGYFDCTIEVCDSGGRWIHADSSGDHRFFMYIETTTGCIVYM